MTSLSQRKQEVVASQETVTVTAGKWSKGKAGKSTSRWVCASEYGIDTVQVELKGDTLTLACYTRNCGSLSTRLVFPLVTGSTWPGPPYPAVDSFVVDQIEKVNVRAGQFAEAHHVRRDIWIPNDHTQSHCWLVREVGIVKLRWYNFFTLGPEARISIWELLSYKVKRDN